MSSKRKKAAAVAESPSTKKTSAPTPSSSKGTPASSSLPSSNAAPTPDAVPAKQRRDDLDLDLDFGPFTKYGQFVWIPLLVAFIAFAALNPDLILEYVNGFLGIEPPVHLPSNSTVFPADVEKRDAVVEAFKHAWRAYERDAMGSDEYHPISQKGTNLTTAGGIGYTVIDSIDTMLIMQMRQDAGLGPDYKRARKWIATKLEFDKDAPFHTFETTIRVLGGLLSAYHLTDQDPLYIQLATDLADRILPAFSTSSGLPYSRINLATGEGLPDAEFPLYVSTAEAATLQLEFRYLAELTGKEVYWRKVERIMEIIKKARQPHGLASIFMHVEAAEFVPSAIRLGSRGDSFYEYLLKQYIQTGQSEEVYKDMYDDAVSSIHAHLIQKGLVTKMTYTAELIPEQEGRGGEISWRRTPKQDHLVCFLGGALMLGATITGANVASDAVSIPPKNTDLSLSGSRDWKTGTALIQTCVATHDTATGLAPEIVYFRLPGDKLEQQTEGTIAADWYIRGGVPGSDAPFDARYILRPETVESLFIAYRLTGDAKYREQGWNIFQAIEKHCKVPTGGYASIINVDQVPSVKEDKMETFLMSETLKYLFLLFEDSRVLPLDEYVFNTEAHPLPIFAPSFRTGFD